MKDLFDTSLHSIASVSVEKSNIDTTDYPKLIHLLNSLKITFKTTRKNIIINLEDERIDKRLMDSVFAGIYIFCKVFEVKIDTRKK